MWADVPPADLDEDIDEHLVALPNGRFGWRICIPGDNLRRHRLCRQAFQLKNRRVDHAHRFAGSPVASGDPGDWRPGTPTHPSGGSGVRLVRCENSVVFAISPSVTLTGLVVLASGELRREPCDDPGPCFAGDRLV